MGNPCKTCLVRPACTSDCFLVNEWESKKEKVAVIALEAASLIFCGVGFLTCISYVIALLVFTKI